MFHYGFFFILRYSKNISLEKDFPCNIHDFFVLHFYFKVMTFTSALMSDHTARSCLMYVLVADDICLTLAFLPLIVIVQKFQNDICKT